MQHPGWSLVVVGVLIAVCGLVWVLAPSIPWLGKLPGDIVIQREKLPVLFPAGYLHCRELGADGDHVGGSVFFTVIGKGGNPKEKRRRPCDTDFWERVVYECPNCASER